MNYSLSSSRKIGNYIQKIITTYNNAEKKDAAVTLYTLIGWHNKFNDLNPTEREGGNIEFKGFTETQGGSNDNLGTKLDITLTVLSTYSNFPKTTTFKVNDVTYDNFETAVNTAFKNLTGYDIKTLKNYIISAIINLH